MPFHEIQRCYYATFVLRYQYCVYYIGFISLASLIMLSNMSSPVLFVDSCLVFHWMLLFGLPLAVIVRASISCYCSGFHWLLLFGFPLAVILQFSNSCYFLGLSMNT